MALFPRPRGFCITSTTVCTSFGWRHKAPCHPSYPPAPSADITVCIVIPKVGSAKTRQVKGLSCEGIRLSSSNTASSFSDTGISYTSISIFILRLLHLPLLCFITLTWLKQALQHPQQLHSWPPLWSKTKQSLISQVKKKFEDHLLINLRLLQPFHLFTSNTVSARRRIEEGRYEQ